MQFIIDNWYWFLLGVVVIVLFVLLLVSKKKTPEVKPDTKQVVEPEATKEEPKKEEKPEEEPIVQEESKSEKVEEPSEVEKEDEDEAVEQTEESDVKKVVKISKYHVSQNKDENNPNYKKWRVRKEGSNKTIKFFDTQKEAIALAEDLAEKAGSSVVIHKVDGSIRKQDYSKKVKEEK